MGTRSTETNALERAKDFVKGSALFYPGINIALKIPAAQFASALRFYTKVLGLPLVAETANSAKIEFGQAILWVDLAEHLEVGEVWLEVRARDLDAARECLKESGIQMDTEVKESCEGSDGFFIRAPGNLVHLISGPGVGWN
jgi:catechol 2,3-dioxygenase-like lactoylglutathione lyase family enzyme